MNARQWLGRARSIDREINALESAKAEAADMLTRTTQNYSADGAQSSKNPHKFDRLVELGDLIDQRVDELYGVKTEITAAIEKLEDGRQRTVLIDYYVRCRTFEQIAVERNFSYRSTLRIHKAGVREIEMLALFGT